MSSVRRTFLVTAFAVLVAALAAALVPGASAHGHDRGHPQRDPAAHHSLRQPVTDQNFYFVMADRFENGDTANDNGDLPPGTGYGESGFDPSGKGWYHGGDLKGLTEKLDYIKGLGTTAIWLTPSFKNKAVQPEDAPRVTTATGSPTSPVSTRTSALTRTCAAWSTRLTRAGSRSSSTSSPTTRRT